MSRETLINQQNGYYAQQNPYAQTPQAGYTLPGQNQAYDPNQMTYSQPVQDLQYNPPVYYQTASNGNYDYQYNTKEIHYQQISVQQWQQVPNDPSQYSQYWQDPTAFEPQTFSSNTKKESKYNDIFFNVFFWINLVGSLGLCGFFISKLSFDTSSSSSTSGTNIYDAGMLKKALLFALGIAVVVNIIHLVYISFAPVFYIKFGIFVGVILALAIAIVPAVKVSPIFFVYPGVIFLFALCWYCIIRKRIPLSAAMLKMSVKLVLEYPSIILLGILEVVVNIIVTVCYCLAMFSIEVNTYSRGWYFYILFSYYWIIQTFSYVIYMSGAGVAGSWYFLSGTDYFPEKPVWASFKRAMTTSFGSASTAGFLLAVVRTLEAIIEADVDSDNGAAAIAILVLKCIALCLLKILEAIIAWINRYALIYCSLFGVPYWEGARRWAELSCKKFVNLLIHSCIIDDAITYNFFVFMLSAAAMGAGVGYISFKSEDNSNNAAYIIFTAVFSFLISVVFFLLLMEPVTVMADTLFVCFAEAPDRLKSSAFELYELICDAYGGELNNKIEKMIKKKNKKNKH